MCGFAGYLALDGPGPGSDVLAGMGSRLAHRGPDAQGHYRGEAAGLGLVHRRLAVLDLSDAGAQPMISASGRFVLAYNGEIYNHLRLRAELDAAGRAPAWRGRSDTETLLALVEAHGPEGTLERLRGMFALALWDRSARRLLLARDRMGEKPLYYGRVGGIVAFASELSAFGALPGFAPAIDREAVGALLRHGCIPAPASIYVGISKLRPGHLAVLSAGAEPVERPWWLLTDTIAATAPARAEARRYDDLAAETEAVLAGVVQDQTISDVPIGTFLSGGVDSSLVTALMVARLGADRVRTFTIGFESPRFDEAEAARAVAAHLGTRHTEFRVSEADALGVVEDLGGIFSEPFADSSQIPAVLLSRLARREVTVALTGDGGDEMFGGYNRHVMAPRLWSLAGWVPQVFRRAGAGLAGTVGGLAGERTIERLTPLAGRLGLPVTTLDRLARFAEALGGAEHLEGFYAGLIGGRRDARLIAPGIGAGPSLPAGARVPLGDGLSAAERLMAWDALWYLPDDVLAKVDRSAMSASLETRAPFLDIAAVEAAWSLPLSARIERGRGKRILRDILSSHLPPALVEHPKQGFAVPLDTWLRGPLGDWAGDRLRPSPVFEEAGIDAAALEALWERHRSGRCNAGAALWPVIMLAEWQSRSRAATAAPGPAPASVNRG